MVEFPLRFAEGDKAKLVDGGGIDHPGMREVQLLVAGVVKTSKPRHIRSRALEEGKWLGIELIRKIVISVELLMVTQLVIDAPGKLVFVLTRCGDGLVLRPIQVGRGHILVHQIKRRGIKTLWRDVVVGKDG
jgi:hypothetical protein